MSKALARRNVALSNPISGQTQTLLVLVALAVIIYLLLKSKPASSSGQYLNEESWDVAYNIDGLPTKITIHRNATRT